ncbi:MAG TPA: right-handed parallel beta-helix repeat-containing protein, partial [Pseudomonadales bacterium]
GSSGSSISNVQLDNLQITDMGRGWSGQRYGSEAYGIRIQADSGAGSIDNTTINGCDINGQANTGIRVLGDTGVTHISKSRIRSNGDSGIRFAAPAGISSARLLLDSSLIYNNNNDGVNFNCPDCQGLVVYHNTFYNNGSINLGIFNQANQALIKNNIFYGSTPMTQLYVNAALAGAEVDFNCYTDGTNMFGYNSVAYDTVAAFNTATGLESAGSGNAAGGLLDPANGQFGLTAASACRSLGTPGTGISSDFAGLPYASPPSAGALEYQP